MNKELQLQLQAYLDSEVSSGEARQIAALLTKDPQAQALYEELRQTKGILAENESGRSLPESGDFYWSKIRRAIDALPEERQTARAARPWWFRVAAPLAGAALLAVALFTLTHQIGGRKAFPVSWQESETPLEDTSTISFFSEAQKMTVVWVQSQEN